MSFLSPQTNPACEWTDGDVHAAYKRYYNALGLEAWATMAQGQSAGAMLVNNEAECHQFSFHGHMTSISDKGQREETQGSGHLGPAFIGVASVREGRGLIPRGMPTLQHLV